MHRWALFAALCLLSACATQAAVAPCVGVAATTCADLEGTGATVAAAVPRPATEATCEPSPSCAGIAATAKPAAIPPDRRVAPETAEGFQPWAEGHEEGLRFVVGDQLQVTLPFYENEDVTTVVAPDGNIYIGLLGSIKAVNRTPAELELELEQRYSDYLRFPDVGVVPLGFGNRFVFVGGEVARPQAMNLRGPTGALEAVFAAGGFSPTARQENVILIRRGPNNLPMMRYLNLNSFANDGTPTENTILRPFDIVFVPKTPIAKLNLFIDQYIDGIVPFNQSFNYILYDVGAPQ